MAERSPEPAKRCARPQSFSASAAGRRSGLDVGEDLDGGGRGVRKGSFQILAEESPAKDQRDVG